jgi:hypothetical protein
MIRGNVSKGELDSDVSEGELDSDVSEGGFDSDVSEDEDEVTNIVDQKRKHEPSRDSPCAEQVSSQEEEIGQGQRKSQ